MSREKTRTDNFAKSLEEIRVAHKLNKREFSELLGVSPQMYSAYLRGADPSYRVLTTITEKFDVNLDWLVRGKGERSIPEEEKEVGKIKSRFDEVRKELNVEPDLFLKELGLIQEKRSSNKPKSVSYWVLSVVSSYGVNPDWLLKGEGEMFSRKWIPLLNDRCLTRNGELERKQSAFGIPEPEGYPEKSFIAWEVSSDETTPRYSVGEVAIATPERTPKAGDDVFVIIKFGEGQYEPMIRRWQTLDARNVELTPYNPSMKPVTIERDCLILVAVVIDSMRSEKVAALKKPANEIKVWRLTDAAF